MPGFWLPSSRLTHNVPARAAFLLSNVAYFAVGRVLMVRGEAHVYGKLLMGVCVASCGYHAAQCLHGEESAHAARWCSVDTALAISVAAAFGAQASINPMNLSCAFLSALFFYDTLGLGYATSHSLWHLSTAACALTSVVDPPDRVQHLEPFRIPGGRLARLAGRLGGRGLH